MINAIWLFFVRLWHRLFGRAYTYRAQHVDDAPDVLKDGLVYIVGADSYDWSALMRCPGGCGKTLEMNLLPSAAPVWQVDESKDGLVGLHPSVWLKTGCGCHFVLRQGRVRWC